MNQRFEAGQFITFMYKPPAPEPKRQYRTDPAKIVKGPDGNLVKVPAKTVAVAAPPPPPSDPNKSVFVLHPNWQNQMHGIDLKRVTPAEVQVLHAIMDPETKIKVDSGQWPVDGVPPYPLIRDILKRLDPVEEIKNPMSFYARFVKPFIAHKDVYRRYKLQYMFGAQIVRESAVQGAITNPRPLFKKI